MPQCCRAFILALARLSCYHVATLCLRSVCCCHASAVSESVCPSHADIVSKRLDWSRIQANNITDSSGL